MLQPIKNKKTAIAIMLMAAFVLGLFVTTIPRTVKAYGAMGFATIVEDIPLKTLETKRTIWDRIKEQLSRATKIAYKNSLRVFLGNLAEDTAIVISTLGTGQKPLFLDNPGKYFEDLGKAAAGDFADTFSTQFLGVSLCQPSFENALQLEFDLQSLVTPQNFCQKSCRKKYDSKVGSVKPEDVPVKKSMVPGQPAELNQDKKITDKFELLYFRNQIGLLRGLVKPELSEEASVKCFVGLEPGEDEAFTHPKNYTIDDDYYYTGISLKPRYCVQIYQYYVDDYTRHALNDYTLCSRECTYSKRTARCTIDEIGENLKNLKSEDFNQALSVYFDPGQNQIGQLVEGFSYALNEEAVSQQRERDIYNFGKLGPIRSKVTGNILTTSDLVQARANVAFDNATVAEQTYTGITEDVLQGSLSIFTNTLIGKLTERFFKGKCGLNPAECAGPASPRTRQGSLLFDAPTGIAAARLQFSSLAKVNYIVGDPSRDEIFVSDDLVSRGIIDSRFKQAVDERLTVRQALDKGLLDGERTFGFTANGNEPTDGYTYTSLLYLRKYRVIPVGWELAAWYNRINSEGSENITLNDLVDAYDDCGLTQSMSCSNEPALSCRDDVDCSGTPTCNADSDCAAPYDTCRTGSDNIGRCQLSCSDVSDCTAAGFGDSCQSGFCVNLSNDCQIIAGTTTPPSPYCGLVDPSWVLKAPPTYCQRRGAGEEIISRDFICDEDTNKDNRIDCAAGGDIGHWQIQRLDDVCADERSCILENDDGSCRAYGYCYEERPSWQFDGDKCDRQNVSCDTFTNPDGVNVSYLTDTLDHYNDAFCNNAAGCQWYCKQPFFDITGNTGTCSPDTVGDKIYLTRAAGICNGTAEGCNEYIQQSAAPNLLPNGNFELLGTNDQRDETPPVADHFPDSSKQCSNSATLCNSDSDCPVGGYCLSKAWVVHLSGDANNYNFFATADANLNDTAMILPNNADGNSHLANRITTGYPLNGRVFTFSYYAKADGACSGNFGFQYFDTSGGTLGSEEVASYSDDWQQYSITRAVPNAPDLNDRIEVYIRNGNINCELTIDAAMLQETGYSGDFVEYADSTKVYLKGNRLACVEDEVGCELYTPVKGGTTIPGVARAIDRCGADAVGCSNWREMAVSHVPYRSEGSVNFNAESGEQCMAQHVGCEEYTNLDKVAQGGEAKEYYTQITQCVTPDNPNIAPFYTWEGSDVSGYQLRVDDFLVAADGSPCTDINQGTATAEPTCAGTDPAAVCQPGDLITDPDCREYFDAVNQTNYLRRNSMTVRASATCNPYRNTIDDQQNLNTIYYIDGPASVSCLAAAAGCREYRGNSGNNVKYVFRDDFEDGDTLGWTGGSVSTESVRVGEHSIRLEPNAIAEDIHVEPNSNYRLSFWAKGETTGNTLAAVLFDQSGTVLSFFGTITITDDWNIYTLGPATTPASVGGSQRLHLTGAGGEINYLDNIELSDMSDTEFVIKDSYVSCDAEDIGCAAYRDRNNNSHYIKSFTRLCSDEVVGCQAIINTYNSDYPYQKIYAAQGVTVPADSVETWVVNTAYQCRSDEQGCQGFGEPYVDQTDIVTSWQTKYLLNEPDSYDTILCTPEQNGCEEWKDSSGAQTFFRDPGSRTCQFSTISTDNQTWNQYNTSQKCPVNTPPPEGQPVGSACVKVCSTGARQGTACVDDADCPGAPAGSCQGNIDNVGTACSSDADCVAPNECQYWAGLCPEDQAGCNEYRDPSDPSNCNSQCPYVEDKGVLVYYDQQCNTGVCAGDLAYEGMSCNYNEQCGIGTCQNLGMNRGTLGCRSYYYIRSTVEDTMSECGSIIDETLGCRSFYDVSNPVTNFRGTN
ncbi:MAG: hypothetical protein V1838_00220 [Patescibacteria group bacterium]